MDSRGFQGVSGSFRSVLGGFGRVLRGIPEGLRGIQGVFMGDPRSFSRSQGRFRGFQGVSEEQKGFRSL